MISTILLALALAFTSPIMMSLSFGPWYQHCKLRQEDPFLAQEGGEKTYNVQSIFLKLHGGQQEGVGRAEVFCLEARL